MNKLSNLSANIKIKIDENLNVDNQIKITTKCTGRRDIEVKISNLN